MADGNLKEFLEIPTALRALGTNGSDPNLIAARYNGLPVGRTMRYSFETGRGTPIDGSNKMARMLSPFTIRIVPPDGWSGLSSRPSRDVNLLGRAGRTAQQNAKAADEVRATYGLIGIEPQDQTRNRSALEQTFSSGRELMAVNGTLRERAILSDVLAAQDIAIQIARILSMPPLTLLVSPHTMTVTYTAVQKYTDRTRTGFVFQRWGEGQTQISFAGSTGAFISGENAQAAFPSRTETTAPSGVQAASRRDSAAWQNFTSLYHFYKNNGYIFDTVGGTEAHLAIGALAIDYDQRTYVGHIENFSYDFKAESPHRVEWQMEFIADRQFDTAGQPLAVLPMRSPNPNPGSTDFGILGAGNSAAGVSLTTGNESFAQTPFQLLGKK